jgi:hypothetical protein
VALCALLVGCGCCGSTCPYEKLDIEPNRTENGVDYYISVVNGSDGSTYAVEFSTLNDVWNMRLLGTWQRLKPQLTLWCAETYTVRGAEGFIEEMGHTIARWEDQGFPDYYLVTLTAAGGDSLPSSVKLMEIIEAYRERADLFAGVMPVN